MKPRGLPNHIELLNTTADMTLSYQRYCVISTDCMLIEATHVVNQCWAW